MSANNWGLCPACAKKREADKKAIMQKIKDSYGGIPEEEYLALLHKVSEPDDIKDTLREDYEICTDKTGLFLVSYSCHCKVCKFSYQFKHEEQVS